MALITSFHPSPASSEPSPPVNEPKNDLAKLRKLREKIQSGTHPDYTAIIKPHALKALSISLAEAALQHGNALAQSLPLPSDAPSNDQTHLFSSNETPAAPTLVVPEPMQVDDANSVPPSVEFSLPSHHLLDAILARSSSQSPSAPTSSSTAKRDHSSISDIDNSFLSSDKRLKTQTDLLTPDVRIQLAASPSFQPPPASNSDVKKPSSSADFSDRLNLSLEPASSVLSKLPVNTTESWRPSSLSSASAPFSAPPTPAPNAPAQYAPIERRTRSDSTQGRARVPSSPPPTDSAMMAPVKRHEAQAQDDRHHQVSFDKPPPPAAFPVAQPFPPFEDALPLSETVVGQPSSHLNGISFDNDAPLSQSEEPSAQTSETDAQEQEERQQRDRIEREELEEVERRNKERLEEADRKQTAWKKEDEERREARAKAKQDREDERERDALRAKDDRDRNEAAKKAERERGTQERREREAQEMREREAQERREKEAEARRERERYERYRETQRDPYAPRPLSWSEPRALSMQELMDERFPLHRPDSPSGRYPPSDTKDIGYRRLRHEDDYPMHGRPSASLPDPRDHHRAPPLNRNSPPSRSSFDNGRPSAPQASVAPSSPYPMPAVPSTVDRYVPPAEDDADDRPSQYRHQRQNQNQNQNQKQQPPPRRTRSPPPPPGRSVDDRSRPPPPLHNPHHLNAPPPRREFSPGPRRNFSSPHSRRAPSPPLPPAAAAPAADPSAILREMQALKEKMASLERQAAAAAASAMTNDGGGRRNVSVVDDRLGGGRRGQDDARGDRYQPGLAPPNDPYNNFSRNLPHPSSRQQSPSPYDTRGTYNAPLPRANQFDDRPLPQAYSLSRFDPLPPPSSRLNNNDPYPLNSYPSGPPPPSRFDGPPPSSYPSQQRGGWTYGDRDEPPPAPPRGGGEGWDRPSMGGGSGLPPPQQQQQQGYQRGAGRGYGTALGGVGGGNRSGSGSYSGGGRNDGGRGGGWERR